MLYNPRMKTTSLVYAVAALISAFNEPVAGALTVDSFDTPQGPLTGAGTFNAVSGAGILGGERDVFLSSFPASSGFSIAGGALTMTQSSGFTSLFVTYDGIDNSSELSMGLGNIDFAAIGTAFRVDLLSTSGATPHSHLWLRAYSSDWGYFETHMVFTPSDFPSSVIIPFDTMEKHGFDSDFASINAVQLEMAIGSGINMDYRVEAVSVIPEASSASSVLFAIIAAMLPRARAHGWTGRRRGRCGRGR